MTREGSLHSDLALVTGASGFIAKHIIKLALARGHRVRGTLRRPDAEASVRAAVGEDGSRLTFATADLLRDEGWAEAVAGCHCVFHVASAFPLVAPRDRDALVPVAREGTLRVLRAAAAAHVERVILTSSCVAVWSGHRPDSERVFTEDDWSIVDSPDTDGYARSKTLAERAAWDFAAEAGLPLTSINPSMVMGPPLDTDVESSAQMLLLFLRGRYPAVPRYGIEMVDVRDVAEAHLRAIERPGTAGRRFIVSSDAMTLREIGRLLGSRFPAFAGRMPRRTLPNVATRLLAPFNEGLRQVAADVGPAKRTSTRAAQDMLGMQFRPAEEAVSAMAERLIDWRLV